MKERLAGAIVLVIIGAWLIPWVLDGPENPVDTSSSSLQLPAAEEPVPMRTQTLRLGGPEPSPPAADQPTAAEPPPAAVAAAPSATEQSSAAPDAAPAAVSEPEPEAERAPVAAAPPPAAGAPSEPRPAVTTPPRATAQAAPATATGGDWVVQLGSFGEEANARRLADRVKTFGYQAQISNYRSGGRTMYRVRVGPYASRNQADAAASALSAHGVVAQVVTAD